MKTVAMLLVAFIGLHTESILISLTMALIIAISLSIKIEKK